MTNRELHRLIALGLCAVFVVLAGVTVGFTGYARWQQRAHRAEMCQLAMLRQSVGGVSAATISPDGTVTTTIPPSCR